MKKIRELWNKINTTQLLLIFLIAQPFLDIYLKVVGERFDIFGFSLTTLIRIGFVVLTLVYILMTKKQKRDILLIGGYLIIIAIYSIIHIYNGQKFYSEYAIGSSNGVLTELLYIFRLTLPILLLYCVYREGVNIKRITKYISLTAVLISTIIVVTDIFKVSFTAYPLVSTFVKDNIFSWWTDGYDKYDYTELTAKGWFYEGNCISAVLVFTFPILLYNAMKYKKWYCYAEIVVQIIAMMMLGSRAASYGWILIYIGYMIFYLLFNAVKKRKYDYIFIGSSIVIILFSLSLLQYSPIRMREKQNQLYRAKYNENKGQISTEYDGKYMINLIHNIMEEKESPIRYIDGINQGKIEPSDKYSYEEVQRLIINNDIEELKNYVINEYIYDNYSENYISNYFINEVYPYYEDQEFWLEVLEMPFEIKADNRQLEKIIIARLKEKNNNFVMDTLFGLNDSALKTRQYIVESDFYNHYYTIGIVGIIILFGPYIIILGYCGIKILLDMKNKFTMGNVMYCLSLIAAMGIGYLSGHLMDEYITSLLMIYILASLLLNVKNQDKLEEI